MTGNMALHTLMSTSSFLPQPNVGNWQKKMKREERKKTEKEEGKKKREKIEKTMYVSCRGILYIYILYILPLRHEIEKWRKKSERKRRRRQEQTTVFFYLSDTRIFCNARERNRNRERERVTRQGCDLPQVTH